jgi:signal transduction histidine kinase
VLALAAAFSLAVWWEGRLQGGWIVVACGLGAILVQSAVGLFVIGLPLRRLARAVREDDQAVAGVMALRSDELGEIARAVGEALAQRHQLAAEVARRAQLTDHLEEANRRLTSELGERAAAEQALRQAEMRNALALQGGNLSLWELFTAEERWMLDRSWFAFLGVTLDPSVSDAEAWRLAVDPADMPDLRQRLAKVGSGELEVLESTFRVRRDDGGRLWVMARGTVVERADDGSVSRLAGTMLDVTRWRELEEQLRQSQKMESIGQLAAGIAHEINTPIQFIGDNAHFTSQAFAALLALQGAYRSAIASHPDPVQQDRIAAVEQQADLDFVTSEVPRAITQTLEGVERVATIVRAMKEFAHPGGTGLTPSDLNHLVDNAIVISRNTWKYVAELEFVPGQDLPPVPLATGDFNQALLNIIVNAAQAIEDRQRRQVGPEGGIIRITTGRDGDHAVLRIADNGCGMPAEVRERIYDPFYTTKEVGRGSGQGLTITRSVIVDRHKGSITCESEPGRGTEFTIRIPLSALA